MTKQEILNKIYEYDCFFNGSREDGNNDNNDITQELLQVKKQTLKAFLKICKKIGFKKIFGKKAWWNYSSEFEGEKPNGINVEFDFENGDWVILDVKDAYKNKFNCTIRKSNYYYEILDKQGDDKFVKIDNKNIEEFKYLLMEMTIAHKAIDFSWKIFSRRKVEGF